MGEEAFPIDRAIEHERGRDAIMAKRGDERRRLLMTAWLLWHKAVGRAGIARVWAPYWSLQRSHR